MRRYWFSLHDRATGQMVGEPQWFSTSEAREHVIRQSMSDQEYLIRRFEDDGEVLSPHPSPR